MEKLGPSICLLGPREKQLQVWALKIFFQIMFVLQENDLVFSSDFEKIALQRKT